MGVTNGKFEDFIGIWDNSLNVGVCKELIKYHNWIIENNYNIRPDIDGSILNHPMQVKDEAIYLSSSSPQYPIALCKTYWDCIYKCVGEYIKNYGIGIQDYLSSFVFKIHKVKESQGYHIWHCENSAYEVRDRFLVFMTYLQAPLEGGETEFLHQSKRIKPVVGRTLIWPTGFTHTHRGNPPLKGEKFYITGWFNICPHESHFLSRKLVT